MLSAPVKRPQSTLLFLDGLCNEIKSTYSLGAHIKICSDGRVFNDLVGVSDNDVSAYTSEIQRLVSDLSDASLSLFNLEAWTSEKDFSEMREQLIRQYAMPLTELRDFIKNHPREQIMLNGIERFLFEDYLFLQPLKTRSAVRKFCHTLAYEVVQRSHAWSALIQSLFPQAIRLSIHPQPCHFEKLGIYLVPSKDNWLTPWHGVALEGGGEFTLMKRWQAEELGAVIVEENGRPDHFMAQMRVGFSSKI